MYDDTKLDDISFLLRYWNLFRKFNDSDNLLCEIFETLLCQSVSYVFPVVLKPLHPINNFCYLIHRNTFYIAFIAFWCIWDNGSRKTKIF